MKIPNLTLKSIFFILSGTSVLAASNEQISQPTLDLKNSGNKLFLFGKFGSYSVYDSSNRNFTLEDGSSNSEANIYSLSPSEGASDIQYIEETDIDEIPSSVYSINDSSFLGIVQGKPLIYDISTLESQELDDWSRSVDGDVNTAYVDSENQIIYLGGDFTYNDDTYSAISYNISSGLIVDLPFRGFGKGSSVNSIIKISQQGDNEDGSILFGGYFSTLGNDVLLYSNVTYNSSLLNSTEDGSSYVDPDQLISLKSAIFSSVNSDSNNDASLICPGSSVLWSLNDGQLGSWTASISNQVVPAKLRLYNPEDSPDGVQYFRIITSPSNGIMNMSYIDPESLEVEYCDAWCPLLLQSKLSSALTSVIKDYENDESDFEGIIQDDVYFQDTESKGFLGFGKDYQEFSFYNDIDVESITVQVMDYHGSKAALSGFQLYQYGIYNYANNTLNEANCASDSSYSSSSLTDTTTWSSYVDVDGTHLTTTVKPSQIKSEIGVIFDPNIVNTGEYSILIYTPGCAYDNTCASRGVVNATLYSGNGTVLGTKLIYQNNEELKYDFIFEGEITASDLVGLDKSFKMPYITMYLTSAINSDTTEIVLVADKVYLQFLSINITPDFNSTETNSDKVSLNGLFEYSLANFTDYERLEDEKKSFTNISFIGNSSLNILGSDDLSSGANITSLLLVNSSLFISGNFDSDYGDNFLAVDIGSYSASLNESEIAKKEGIVGGGLNGEINRMYPIDNGIILIGDFDSTENKTTIEELTNSSSLSHLALYSNDTWTSIGGGSTIDSESLMVNVTFNSTEYLVFNGLTENVSVFDYTNSQWLDDADSEIFFNISQAVSVNGSATLVFGFISLTDGKGSDGLVITEDGVSSLPITFTDQAESKINSGAYINDSMIVVGGKFETEEGYQNLAFINTSKNSTAGGFADLKFDDDAQVNNLFVLDNVLYISFTGEATRNGDTADGMIAYGLSNSTLMLVEQNKATNVGNSTSSSDLIGQIISIEEDPQHSNLIVGGNFTNLGNNKDCDTLCLFYANNDTWSYPADKSISGTINQLTYFAAYQVLLGGDDLTVSGDSGPFALFNTKNRSLSTVSAYKDVPGPVKKFQLLDNQIDGRLIALGDNYLSYYNGSEWQRLDKDLDTDSTSFSDFQILALSTDRSSTGVNALSNNETLLVTGNLKLNDYGTVNAAFYDGSNWTPYLIVDEDGSSNNAAMGSILTNTKRTEYTGTFPSSTPSSTPKSSDSTEPRYFTTGQVVGIGCALSLATMTLLTAIGVGVYLFSQRSTTVTPLKYRVGEEKMMNAVPLAEVMNNMSKVAPGVATK